MDYRGLERNGVAAVADNNKPPRKVRQLQLPNGEKPPLGYGIPAQRPTKRDCVILAVSHFVLQRLPYHHH